LTDLSVSGATLLNVLNEPQTTKSGETFPPQLQHLSPDTDIVTLTSGGNDMGYSSGMIRDSLMSYTGPLKDMIEGLLDPPPAAISADQLTDRLTSVIDKIREIAPKAKIYLIEYLAVLGPATQPNNNDMPLDRKLIEHYEERARSLANSHQNAASARSGVECVAMAKDSEGHCVGSAEPWVTGFSLTMFLQGIVPYHPNLAGHTAVAEVLHRRIVDAKEDLEPSEAEA